MIPASYMFKDVYQQNWLDSAVVVSVDAPKPRLTDGLLTGFGSLLAAILPRQGASNRHYSSVHVYE